MITCDNRIFTHIEQNIRFKVTLNSKKLCAK